MMQEQTEKKPQQKLKNVNLIHMKRNKIKRKQKLLVFVRRLQLLARFMVFTVTVNLSFL